MVVSFVETMRGGVRDNEGAEHPLEFNIKAEAPTVKEFFSHGVTRVAGLIRAAPWAAEAVVEGTLELSPIRRRIGYHLEFRSSSGDRLRLDGAKSVQWQAPLYSMTHLPVTLQDQHGSVLSSGELRFDLRELLPFAASWLPFPRKAQLLLDVQRRAVERRLLAGA